MNCGRRVVSISEAQPAAIGIERQQVIADEFATWSAPCILMMWRCTPALLVTRPETRLPRFDEAVHEMRAAGWPVVLRKSGGRACPVGPGTVQISTIETAAPDASIDGKYDALTTLIRSVLACFKIESRTGPVADAYCAGRYDLSVQGKKIAGMSQHWFRNRHGIRCIITSGSLNVEEPPDVLADVVNRFYAVAGNSIHCRAEALTSMRMCKGTSDVADPNFMSMVMTHFESSYCAAA